MIKKGMKSEKKIACRFLKYIFREATVRLRATLIRRLVCARGYSDYSSRKARPVMLIKTSSSVASRVGL